MRKQFLLFSIFIMVCFGTVTRSTAQNISVNRLDAVSGKNWDIASDMALDSKGNLWFVAGFEDTVHIGKKTLVSTGDRDVLIAKYDTDGKIIFTRQITGTDYQHVSSVCVDKNDNLWLTGSYKGTAYFGSDSVKAAGDLDNFIVRYNKNGKQDWLKSYHTDCRENPIFLFTDKQNNLYWAGSFYYFMNFGDSVYYSRGGSDMFIAKLDDKGHLKKFKQIGGIGNDRIHDVVMDNDGNILITGSFEDKINLDKTTLKSFGAEDFFAAKLNTNLDITWNHHAGSIYSDYGSRLVCDADGEYYAVGDYEGTFHSDKDSVVSLGFSDVFIIKYDKKGKAGKLKSIGGPSSDNAGSVSLINQNIYIAGTYCTSMQADKLKISGRDPMSDVFLCRLNNKCEPVWLETLGGNGPDYAQTLISGPDNNLYISGGFCKNFAFGRDSLNTGNTNDLFVARFFDCDFGGGKIKLGTDTVFNGSGTLNAGKGFEKYIWNTNYSGQKITVSGSGTYTVEATDKHGCTSKSSVKVTVMPIPEIITEKEITDKSLTGEESNVNIANTDNKISVYPNPCNGNFTVQIPKSKTGEPTNIKIYSQDGKLMYNKTTDAERTEIRIQTKGIYTLVANGEVTKIVIND
jgi:hypothetical protein